MTTLRKLRRQMDIISAEVSMVRDIRDREIRILTHAGRFCRHFLIVEETPCRNAQGGGVQQLPVAGEDNDDKEDIIINDDKQDIIEVF